MDKAILRRLERLEEKGLSDTGVSILELREDGKWELICTLTNGSTIKSVHQTQEEGVVAHREFLRKHKRDENHSALIIIDL